MRKQTCMLHNSKIMRFSFNRLRGLVLTCLNRFEAKNLDKTGIIMLYATECQLEMTKICHIAHVLHGKSHITRANIFSLYF